MVSIVNKMFISWHITLLIYCTIVSVEFYPFTSPSQKLRPMRDSKLQRTHMGTLYTP